MNLSARCLARAGVQKFQATMARFYLVFLISSLLTTITSSGSLLLPSLDTSLNTSCGVWRGDSEINVLLALQADQERGNVHDLLANTDVALANENTSMVNGLGQVGLEHDGLKSSVQEVLVLEIKDKIELVLALIHDTEAVEATEEGSSFKESLGVLLLELEQLSRNLTHLGQCVMDSPDFSLVFETILTDDLQLLVQPLLLKGVAGCTRHLVVCWLRHGDPRLYHRVSALTHFYPLAGRIKGNSFVDCNDEGIPFNEAQVKCRLSDLLHDPVPDELNKLYPFPLDDAKVLPMGIQLNTFDCGGIGIALCISHKIGDALSYFTFLNTWAAIARGDTKNVVLPEFVSAKLFPPRNISLPEPALETSEKNIATKRVVFSASKIEEIRAKYAADHERRPSRVEALSAYIWSRFIASTKKKPSPNVMIHTVNLRTKFEPPLSAQSFGNIFRVAITVPSMDDGSNLVSQIRNSIRKIDNDYVRKLQAGEDLFEPTNQGDEKGETTPFIFTSLCRFPLYDADFGWGKPVWVSSARLSAKNLVVFMDTATGDGIEAWINLKEEDMAEFGSDEELLATLKSC